MGTAQQERAKRLAAEKTAEAASKLAKASVEEAATEKARREAAEARLHKVQVKKSTTSPATQAAIAHVAHDVAALKHAYTKHHGAEESLLQLMTEDDDEV